MLKYLRSTTVFVFDVSTLVLVLLPGMFDLPEPLFAFGFVCVP